MSRAKNHERRRHELLEAVWNLIERGGLDNVTVRSIATESGWSTGSLAHYFKDKEHILTAALRLSHQEILKRWDGALDGLPPMEALQVFLLDNLPLDDRRRRETILEVAYWARAIGDDEVRSIQREEAKTLKQRLVSLLEDARLAGDIHFDLEQTDQVAERFLALIDGISLHSILYPDRVDSEMAVGFIDDELDRLTPSRGANRE